MSIYAEKRVPYKIQCLHEPARVTLLPTKKFCYLTQGEVMYYVVIGIITLVEIHFNLIIFLSDKILFFSSSYISRKIWMHKFNAQNNLSGLFFWSCSNVLEQRATTHICISCDSVQFKIPKVNDGALFFLFARISYNVSSRQSEK